MYLRTTFFEAHFLSPSKTCNFGRLKVARVLRNAPILLLNHPSYLLWQRHPRQHTRTHTHTHTNAHAHVHTHTCIERHCARDQVTCYEDVCNVIQGRTHTHTHAHTYNRAHIHTHKYIERHTARGIKRPVRKMYACRPGQHTHKHTHTSTHTRTYTHTHIERHEARDWVNCYRDVCMSSKAT